jgi:predicted PurR-regulated permease PerM
MRSVFEDIPTLAGVCVIIGICIGAISWIVNSAVAEQSRELNETLREIKSLLEDIRDGTKELDTRDVKEGYNFASRLLTEIDPSSAKYTSFAKQLIEKLDTISKNITDRT